MTSSRSASRRRRRGREPRTEPVQRLRTASYDATKIEFTGASGTGLPDGGVFHRASEPGICGIHGVPRPCGICDGTSAAGAPAGYAATTGPVPVYGRPAITIGDALTHDETWGPKLAPLPCGHCGAPPPVPAGILERTRIIGHVNWLALQDGWKFDYDLTWTCPACQQDDAWKARQGQLELHKFGEPCDRHDLPAWPDVHPDECRCTCPGAVLAVDVMLASEDHLGSGRARHRTVTR